MSHALQTAIAIVKGWRASCSVIFGAASLSGILVALAISPHENAQKTHRIVAQRKVFSDVWDLSYTDPWMKHFLKISKKPTPDSQNGHQNGHLRCVIWVYHPPDDGNPPIPYRFTLPNDSRLGLPNSIPWKWSRLSSAPEPEIGL